MKRKRLLFVVNSDWFFVSHRLPLALAAKDAGYEVHLATEYSDKRELLNSLGIHTHRLRLNRSGMNPLEELRTLYSLWRIFSQTRPDLIHLITPKCVIYGGMIARIRGGIPVLAAISGLGTAFSMSGIKGAILRSIVVRLYRFALSGSRVRVIFQNSHDQSVFKKFNIVSDNASELINGSGVCLDTYRESAELSGTPVVTFAARLLREKGVTEFIEAAQILARRGTRARWVISGKLDPENRTSITAEEIFELDSQRQVEFIGFCDNIPELFARSHLVVLPSYYREGLPKVLIEAAACGRAVVTTTNPGCIDAIIPEVTGLAVPCRNTAALADAIEILLHDGERRKKWGKKGAVGQKKPSLLRGLRTVTLLYTEPLPRINTANLTTTVCLVKLQSPLTLSPKKTEAWNLFSLSP